jgi:hypothetical protein
MIVTTLEEKLTLQFNVHKYATKIEYDVEYDGFHSVLLYGESIDKIQYLLFCGPFPYMTLINTK